METTETSLSIIAKLKTLKKHLKNIRDYGYGKIENSLIYNLKEEFSGFYMEELIDNKLDSLENLNDILNQETLKEFDLKSTKKECDKLIKYIHDFSQTNKCPCCNSKQLHIIVDVNNTKLEDGSDEWYAETWSFKVGHGLKIIDNLPNYMYAMDKDRVLYCENCHKEYNATSGIHYGEINEKMRTKVKAIREKSKGWI